MRKIKIPTKPVTWANPQYAAAMRELRRSNAAGLHTPKPLKGTRTIRNDRAIKDSKDN